MAKHHQSHLAQTLQDMLSAQGKLQHLHTIVRRVNAQPDSVERREELRVIGGAVYTQGRELDRAAQCLSTMYPAANEPVFEVVL